MAVAFNSSFSPFDQQASGVTSLSSSRMTVGNGSQRALTITLSFSLQTLTGLTVTWDSGGTNQTMSSVITANAPATPGRADIWGVTAPVSGNLTLLASWTGSSDCYMDGADFTGVSQVGGATSFPNSTSANNTSTSPSLGITSSSSDWTICAGTNKGTNFTAATQTELFNDNSAATIWGVASQGAGAATVTHAWTLGASVAWVLVGTDVAAAVAAAVGYSTPWYKL